MNYTLLSLLSWINIVGALIAAFAWASGQTAPAIYLGLFALLEIGAALKAKN